MKTIKICLIFLALSSGNSFAQQEAQYTQYMDNMLYYNPAYAGSRDAISITGLHRQQWVGFKGAPMTTSFSIHSPIKNSNVGLGLSFLNDRVGPTNTNWINADFSYSLRFKKSKSKLSFGVKAGVHLLNGDLAGLTKQDASDVSLNTRYKNEVKPNLGGGIYYHAPQWFVGVTVPRILETQLDPFDAVYLDQRHYYLMAGGYFNASRMLKIRPSAMLKLTEEAPFALDLSLAFIFYDKLWLGANYRLEESAGFILQYQISDQFKIGYGLDIATTRLVKTNAGSHEILLSYNLRYKQKSLLSPRMTYCF